MFSPYTLVHVSDSNNPLAYEPIPSPPSDDPITSNILALRQANRDLAQLTRRGYLAYIIRVDPTTSEPLQTLQGSCSPWPLTTP